MQIGRDYKTVNQCKDWLCKIDIEQRFRRRDFEDLSVLLETSETLFAEFEEMIAQCSGRGSMADGKESVPARAFGLLQHALRDLAPCAGHHLLAADRAVTPSHAAERQ